MGIWFELYGKQNSDFVEGVIAGVEMYSVMRDGKYIVGIQERPLKEVVKEIKEDLLENAKR